MLQLEVSGKYQVSRYEEASYEKVSSSEICNKYTG